MVGAPIQRSTWRGVRAPTMAAVTPCVARHHAIAMLATFVS